VELSLPYREPMDLIATLAFLGTRAIPGVENYESGRYDRSVRAPGGAARISVCSVAGTLSCTLTLTDPRDAVMVTSLVRRLLDLDSDPNAIDEHLRGDVTLSMLVAHRRGLRSPGAVDRFEMAVRAVVGQQISVRGARTVLGRIAAEYGARAFNGPELLLFPNAATFAAVDPVLLPMPRARGRALLALAEACAAGDLILEPSADRERERARLLALPGIGPWTADYLRMRAG
jgi:AraC family transcriptional regulator of adaptative response / DNA-3-methyladenine glycosylase II